MQRRLAGSWVLVFGGDWAGEGRRKKNEIKGKFGGLGPAEEEVWKKKRNKKGKKKKKKKEKKEKKKIEKRKA